MSNLSQYHHKGYAIRFDAGRAQFQADVVGKTLSAPSLDALKKKIDKVATFEPFEAYFEETGWQARGEDKGARLMLAGEHTGKRALFPCEVIGVEKDRFNRHRGPNWSVRYMDGKKPVLRVEAAVLPRTEEAVAAWRALWERRESCKAAEKALEDANAAELIALQKAVPFKSASVS